MFTRRDFLAAAAPLVARPRQPNFIVMVTDDQGYHDLGCQGAQELKTPRLDALAASGARFTGWDSNAPMCASSRASLLTGRYPQRAGVPTNGPALPLSEQTIASLLKARGYSTALIGKWHLGSTLETVPNARGFDYPTWWRTRGKPATSAPNIPRWLLNWPLWPSAGWRSRSGTNSTP